MKTAAYRKSNKHFTFHNANPKNSLSSGDCVVRAISFITGDDWETVYNQLCRIGLKMKAMPNDKKVYEAYLAEKGSTKFSQPKKPNNTKYSVQEFATKFAKDKSYIVSVANHLTAVKNGKIFDTWDCGESCVGNYWGKN